MVCVAGEQLGAGSVSLLPHLALGAVGPTKEAAMHSALAGTCPSVPSSLLLSRPPLTRPFWRFLMRPLQSRISLPHPSSSLSWLLLDYLELRDSQKRSTQTATDLVRGFNGACDTRSSSICGENKVVMRGHECKGGERGLSSCEEQER